MNGYEPEEAVKMWWWVSRDLNARPLPFTLPPEVFSALPPSEHPRNSVAASYPTRQEALQALAVAMGRADKQ